MKFIYLCWFKITQYVQTVKNIYEIVILGLALVLFLAISIITTNRTIELWSSLFLGFTTALVLAKLPAIIVYFKGGKQGTV